MVGTMLKVTLQDQAGNVVEVRHYTGEADGVLMIDPEVCRLGAAAAPGLTVLISLVDPPQPDPGELATVHPIAVTMERSPWPIYGGRIAGAAARTGLPNTGGLAVAS